MRGGESGGRASTRLRIRGPVFTRAGSHGAGQERTVRGCRTHCLAVACARYAMPVRCLSRAFHSPVCLVVVHVELKAYAAVLNALRAQGELSWKKEGVLQDLRLLLHITEERHRLELQRVATDAYLTHSNLYGSRMAACSVPCAMFVWLRSQGFIRFRSLTLVG